MSAGEDMGGAGGRASYIQVRRAVAVLVVALAFTLLLVDAVLLQRNSGLRRIARAYFQSIGPPVGRTVPALAGIDAGGKRVVAPYGANPRKTVLFVFSPECRVCDLNWPAWHKLITVLDHRSVRLVFVNLGPELTNSYICKHGIGADLVIAKPDPEIRDAYNLKITPETVLLSNTGKIENAWVGALDPKRFRSVESSLGIAH